MVLKILYVYHAHIELFKFLKSKTALVSLNNPKFQIGNLI